MTDTTLRAALQVAAGCQACAAQPAPGAQFLAAALQQLAKRVEVST
ncbi:MAG TPA: hypothetical protein VK464_04415 [Symbiobacteriaceae bacterium]|jgi:hypothetical protein|nr:hypothetical protein [Symbiobacteriaceae bacterium]